MFARLNQTATNWTVLGQWLGDKDCDALKAEKLSVVELAKVVRTALSYYEDHYGSSGEGSASAG